MALHNAHTTNHPRVSIKKSGKRGYGLVAKKRIARGEEIVDYNGVIVDTKTAKEMDDRYNKVFTLDEERALVGDIQREKDANFGVYANDAFQTVGAINNAEFEARQHSAVLRATREIKAGEEIYNNYGSQYFEEQPEERFLRFRSEVDRWMELRSRSFLTSEENTSFARLQTKLNAELNREQVPASWSTDWNVSASFEYRLSMLSHHYFNQIPRQHEHENYGETVPDPMTPHAPNILKLRDNPNKALIVLDRDLGLVTKYFHSEKERDEQFTFDEAEKGRDGILPVIDRQPGFVVKEYIPDAIDFQVWAKRPRHGEYTAQDTDVMKAVYEGISGMRYQYQDIGQDGNVVVSGGDVYFLEGGFPNRSYGPSQNWSLFLSAQPSQVKTLAKKAGLPV